MAETHTVRIREDDYAEIQRLAELNDEPIREIVHEFVQPDMGDVVGFCPEHGVRFRESDVESPLFSADYVECPVKYESGEAREFAHQDLTNGMSRIPAEKLSDDPPGLETDSSDSGDSGNDSDDDDGDEVVIDRE